MAVDWKVQPMFGSIRLFLKKCENYALWVFASAAVKVCMVLPLM